MLGTLAVLAFLSLFGGLLFNVPKILEGMFPIAEEVPGEAMLMGISIAAGLIGIALSYYMYVMNPKLPQQVTDSLGGLYRVVYNKYFVDEIYDAAVVTPMVTGSRGLLWKVMDQGIIDGAVNGVGNESMLAGG